MLDLDWIIKNQEEFEKLVAARGIYPVSKELITLDGKRRHLITVIQLLRQAQNEKSKLISTHHNVNSKDFEDLKKDATHIKEKLDELEIQLNGDNELTRLLENLPNLSAADVPIGASEKDNKELRKWGTIKTLAKVREHQDLGVSLKQMDFVQTAKISGSRFVTLKSGLAKLERALINFMLDVHTQQHGYTEISPPYLVHDQAMFGTGQLPKLAEDSFKTTDGFRLIPTAEVPLANLVADMIIPLKELPLRFVAHSPCFRSEAGAAGRDTKGMIRLHQFAKVELVSITTPSQAEAEHEYITNAAETILRKLELPYRVMLLCSGDMSFQAKKTYDIEVWLPGQKKYREISSCSNCGDFQARRMKSRYKEQGAAHTTFVHTLNGSALAVGRTIVAIMENYQNEDGSITIPAALIDYMGGMKKIELNKELELV